MKFSLAFLLLGNGVTAFAPGFSNVAKSSQRSMADVSATEEEEEATAYPTVNGWTADPQKFCAGLPGATAPLGEFDPLGFTKDLPVQEIKRYREAEVTHGRVAMLATLGYLVAEPFHPFFGGQIDGPANSHLGQVQETEPFFFLFLATAIGTWEIARALIGWERPLNAIEKNKDIEQKTWLSKLNDDYYPGDIGFDPLGMKPETAEEFADIQTKELNNGRLAMLAAIGMMVQEQVTGQTLF